jgi:hypothetical protein
VQVFSVFPLSLTDIFARSLFYNEDGVIRFLLNVSKHYHTDRRQTPEHSNVRFFRDFPQSLKENAGLVAQLGHNHFLADPFQFICHPTI